MDLEYLPKDVPLDVYSALVMEADLWARQERLSHSMVRSIDDNVDMLLPLKCSLIRCRRTFEAVATPLCIF
jgi:hypothetical protein